MKIKREETGESFASSTISESLELAPAEAPTGCLSKNSALSPRGMKKEVSAAEERGCKKSQDPKYGPCIFLLPRRLLHLSVIFECVVNLQSGLFVSLSNNSTGRLAATSNILRNFIYAENPASY